MSLKVDYETPDEAQMRLENTIVLYDGEPVYINRIAPAQPGDTKADIFRVYARPLPLSKDVPGGPAENEEFRKYISSKKFDLKTIKMGFMNLKSSDEIYYCTRDPKRQTKQGICANTLNVNPIIRANEAPFSKKNFFNNALYQQEFVDMVKGRYPSFGEAMNAITKEKRTAVAFSREFAVVRDNEIDSLVFLYHKNNKVGYILDDKISLSKRMVCLRESLQELGLRV